MVKKLVVVGAGFGGLYAIKNLKRDIKSEDLEVTLYNPTNYFLFAPMLHEVATGGLAPELLLEPIKQALGDMPVNTVTAMVDKIDLKERIVFSSGKEESYDYLILATGAQTNDYGIEGVQEHTLGLKSIDDAISIKNRIIDAFDKANSGEDVSLCFSVVGGGATGVELVAEMSELIYSNLLKINKNVDASQVSLNLFSDDGLVSYYSEQTQSKVEKYLKKIKINVHTKTKVAKVEAGGIHTNNGFFECGHIIWAAGVKPTYPELLGNFELDPAGRLKVNELLQLERHSDAFVIGDVASGHPMLAYTATVQAKNIAGNISKLVSYAKDEHFDNRDANLKTFKFTPMAKLMSLGQSNAVAEMFGMKLSGKLIWFLWRTIYLSKVHTFRKQFEIAVQWTFNLFSPRDTTRI